MLASYSIPDPKIHVLKWAGLVPASIIDTQHCVITGCPHGFLYFFRQILRVSLHGHVFFCKITAKGTKIQYLDVLVCKVQNTVPGRTRMKCTKIQYLDVLVCKVQKYSTWTYSYESTKIQYLDVLVWNVQKYSTWTCLYEMGPKQSIETIFKIPRLEPLS